MGNTPTERSKPKPSQSDENEIIELAPPADFGFSGTAKFYAEADSVLIAELLKRGYTKVESARA